MESMVMKNQNLEGYKPIEINMNIKIEHEIRLKIEKDVDELLSTQKGLF